MGFWSSDKDSAPTAEKQLADQVSELYSNRDLFGVADLMCKQSPEMMRKVQPLINLTTSIEIKPHGEFDLKIGGHSGSRSVTVGSDTCPQWKK